ncbi:hypothetical protein [Amycolatopsis anabasis]|uniref:hypothetical protein n=1 Tax=Amycolatopsis anabasis TaxID=1840409 RepID=UPI00131CD11C|nr:hypothetical protein [Amycolatopsis anabasis]
MAAILLKGAARQQLLTQSFGGWPVWSDSAESLSKREHSYAPGAIGQVWDYLVRGLPG